MLETVRGASEVVELPPGFEGLYITELCLRRHPRELLWWLLSDRL